VAVAAGGLEGAGGTGAGESLATMLLLALVIQTEPHGGVEHLRTACSQMNTLRMSKFPIVLTQLLPA
jgi:hypothetical protein